MHLECYDRDIVSSDDLLGSLELNLLKMTEAVPSSVKCKMNKKSRQINLFKVKASEKNGRSHRGWWAFNAHKDKNRLGVSKLL